MELDRFKDIRLQGYAKLFHRLFMGITYPLRHPFRFVLLVLVIGAVLIAVPLSRGVSYQNIRAWYFPQKPVSTPVVQPKKPTLPAPHVLYQPVFDDEQSDAEVLPLPPEPVAAPKEYAPMKLPPKWREGEAVLRQEEAAEVAPQENLEPAPAVEEYHVLPAPSKEEITTPEAKVSTATVMPQPEPKSEPKPAFRKDEKLSLVYEDNPKIVKGKAMVFSPNELTVAKTYMFLYGIYTNPKKHDMKAAEQYLKELVRGKVLECYLVAYTYENLPTGVCYLDGRSINQNMVDAGFADNVAL